MLRFLFPLIGSIIAVSATMGQTIAKMSATFDDYMPLLQSKGYDAYAFDISGLDSSKVQLVFTVREYEGGKMVKDNVLPWSPSFYNMRLLTDIDEQYRQNFIDAGLADAERGITDLARKITIGLMPEDGDSLKRFMITVDNMGSVANQLHLKPQTKPQTGKDFYAYATRPFSLANAPAKGYVPLVLLGSVWYDERIGMHRLCGENEIDPDLTKKDKDSMVQFIPHFYVFGVDIKPVD